MAGKARTIVWTARATTFVRLLNSDQRRAIASVLANLARGKKMLLVSVGELPVVFEVACSPPAHGLRFRITFGEGTVLVLGFVAPRPR